jgi:SAM-dependent methyltransferase
VACGTGKHLELLRPDFDVEGLDADPDMLAIARTRLGPDVPLHTGSFVDFDLGRTFDVVTCLFSSIAYARTEANLDRATAALARHVGPGGVLVLEPFFAPDTWEPGNIWAIFVDEPDLKIARMDVSAPPVDGVVRLEFHYLVGTPDGIDHFTEPHEVGLFTREQHLHALEATGLDVGIDEEGLMGRGLYVARRPARTG